MRIYRLHQIDGRGHEWTSSESFSESETGPAARAVVAGHLLGSLRWATVEGTGEFISGLDQAARPLSSSPASADSCYLADGSRVRVPAVKIYNPTIGEIVRVRGFSSIALVMVDSVCVGWTEI